ncbi:MAG: thiamine pyrophosphate-dependent enzyme [Sulfolobales archaeon]
MIIETYTEAHPIDKYVRVEKLPTLWCPGCGNGIVMHSLLRVIDKKISQGKLDENQIVFVGGIGCASRIAMYVNFDSIRTAHGRAIPLATAIKILRPEMKVIIVGGDGDLAGIGGNHLLHAMRRNTDLLVVLVNNLIYGMTGGQQSPMTPQGIYTTTTPKGNPERPLNIMKLAYALGVSFAARGSVTHPYFLDEIFSKALDRRGFSLVEVLSICPEIFGRHIGYRRATELFMEFKKRVILKRRPTIEESDYDWNKGFVIGIYVDKEENETLSSTHKSIS